MIKLTNIKIHADHGDGGLKNAAARTLGIAAGDIEEIKLLRRSVDARKKPAVFFLYTVAVRAKNEAALLRRGFEKYTPPARYAFPAPAGAARESVVIAGMGPAGLFGAYCLTMAGVKCVLLERGQSVERRVKDIERFWRTGELDESSNVQFGEGGAGTFSDGKLATGIKDGRIPFVLETFVKFGAPEDILYLSAPHVGTDNLRRVVANMREYLISHGCDIRFGAKLDGLSIESGALRGVSYTQNGQSHTINTKRLILAVGNSARDTFRMLREAGVKLSKKSFSVGVRIEHLQRDIDLAQYSQAATLGTLPASNYKLAVHLPNGRSAYTFCVCPGGQVIAAASQRGGVVTNGMSQYARDGENCAGGLLVGVTPEDFDDDVLSGMFFQDEIEHRAFIAGGGDYRAPAQLVGDFLARRPSTGAGRVKPTYAPGVKWCSLWDVLPEFVCETIAQALPEMDRKIHGFADSDAVLTAVESRSSSPIRIDRKDFRAAGIEGLYPCGEGAGYAGGITSAAVDGIKCAEAVCEDMAREC
ncbi:MAG: hypothetical protein IJ072_02955 [Oscillospiraceae bacterium]|nr:hypothetical protein [Oscillospiraceae bacterium]